MHTQLKIHSQMKPLVLILLGACTVAVPADPMSPAIDNPNWFPFPIDVADSTTSPINLGFLQDSPAGSQGFLKVMGEHLIDDTGKVVRLFGTNFCGSSCFPPAEEAVSVAAHLKKNGVNIVRLHHMDNDWSPQSTLIANNALTTLDAGNLDRLDRLAAELIKQGIFLNINLHVSRTYENTPKGAPDYSKGLDYFHPPFIAAFKSYARQLLTHVNPYTKRAYKDEPGVAIVEMNNENTLVQNPWWLAELGEPFRSELRNLFIAHLKKTYSSTSALQASWGINDGSIGPDLIRNGNYMNQTEYWNSEANHGAAATLVPIEGGICWTGKTAGAQSWSIQLSQNDLGFDERSAYRVSFRARSASSAKLQIHAQNSAPPWTIISPTELLTLTPEWTTYTFEFSPASALPGPQNRIVFSLLNQVTSIDLTDVRIHAVSSGYLLPEQTLEAANLPLPERRSKPIVRKDFLAFLIQLEIDHALEMKRFIRGELGVKSLITHSATLFGGISGVRRELRVSDLVDTHGYWQHPGFPNIPWDMGDWSFENTSQLTSASGGTLAEMAMQRPIGMPYSVSEYDIPAPLDSAAETFPLLAAMAGLQDWSAIYHFNFKNGLPYASDRITGFFDLPGNPAKQAFMPLAALSFRQGLITPFSNSFLLAGGDSGILDYVAEKSGEVWGSWRDLWQKADQTGLLAWRARVGYDLSNDAAQGWTLVSKPTTPTAPSAALMNPTDGTFVLRDEKVFLFSGPQQKTVSHPAGFSVTFPSPQIGTVMLVPLDGQPLTSSKKLWLCALGRAENPGMGWNSQRSSVGKEWGTGPALVLGLRATLTLPGNANWKIQALSPTGAPVATLAENAGEMTLDPAQRTVWWYLTRE